MRLDKPSRHAVGHTIEAVSFGERRHLECSCGLVILQSKSDDEQGSRFYSHRQVAPPERPQSKGSHQGLGIVRQTETMAERTRGW